VDVSYESERPFEAMTVADVFCGAGGLSEGFRSAARADGSRGFEVAFGVDRDPDCIATYRANVLTGSTGDRERRGQLRSVVGLGRDAILSAAGVKRIDVLIGGPNCQAVSSAGRRNLEDERNSMFEEYVRLVEELQPRWFLMENVPGLTHANGLPLLGEIFERFGELRGYTFAGDVLLAADLGVPQYRYRLFLIGTRTGLPVRLPAPSHFRDGSPAYLTVEDAIGSIGGGSPPVPIQGETVLNERRIGHVPPGGDWRDIPVDLLPDRSFGVRSSDQKGAYGRMSWSEPSFTITGLANNMTAGPFAHPEQDRVITTKEAAALQGFRDDYRFHGSSRSQMRQIGNAVPPPVATALAEAILGIEDGRADALRAPRLTPQVVAEAVAGKKRLPIMTPRVTRTVSAQPGRTAPAKLRSRPSPMGPPGRPTSTILARLNAEAALPKYSWTGKRAKAILGGIDGKDMDVLSEELKISPTAAKRWYQEFVESGIEGWRAYHTPIQAIVGSDEVLISRIEAVIEDVRRPTLVAEVREGRARSHMNRHLRRLIRQFEGQSVNEIKRRLAVAGHPVGTMYVGDLLAVASVLLEQQDSAEGQAAIGRR
jgi:DNA (cytosine-5)-methyltransferase 1